MEDNKKTQEVRTRIQESWGRVGKTVEAKTGLQEVC